MRDRLVGIDQVGGQVPVPDADVAGNAERHVQPLFALRESLFGLLQRGDVATDRDQLHWAPVGPGDR